MHATTSPNHPDLTDLALAEQRARILRALGNPVRLRIIASLAAAGEQTVGRLQEALDLPQSTVSRQLAWLRVQDLVAVRSDGGFRHYTITMPQLVTLLGCLQDCGRNNSSADSQES